MEIVGNIYKGNKQAGRIYSKDGICPTLSAMEGGNTEPKIIERDTPMKGNYKEPRICTMVGRDPNNPSSRVRSDHYEQFLEMGDDVSNTLTSVQKDNLVAEPTIRQRPHGFNKGGVHHVSPTLTGSAFQENNLVAEPQPIIIDDTMGYEDDNRIYNQYSPALRSERSGLKVAEPQGVSVHPNSHALEFKGEQSIKQDAAPALRATDYKAPHCVWEKEPSYRIRKLTPRECFRLMGVSETNIDKIQQSGVSQSQQYKMAGNSIVVDCLYHLFRKMLTETHCESQQLSLF